MKMISRILGFTALLLVMLITGGWGFLALFYAGPNGSPLQTLMLTLFGIVFTSALIAVWLPRWRWRLIAGYLASFMALLFWFNQIQPTNERDWQADVAILPYATVDGDQVIVHNIRNFNYTSETRYEPSYYDKRFDLRELAGVDLIATYWMGPAIAHVFLSFEFSSGDHLAISIETRKEEGESYSTLQGFFRRYELYYVVADERDVIGLRTNFRDNPPEDVYVYRVQSSTESRRRLFLEYIRKINGLTTDPQFYNTFTTNCTTSIWMNALVNEQHVPFSWKILLSGYVPEYLFENDRLVSKGLNFADLQERAHINSRARAAGNSGNFSQLIRQVNSSELDSNTSIDSFHSKPSAITSAEGSLE